MIFARVGIVVGLAAWLCLCAPALRAQDPAKEAFDRAVAAFSAGDYARAEQEFRAVLKLQPRHIAALSNLGVVYSRLGRSDQAIAVYNRALQVSPNDKAILLNLGLAYLKQEAHSLALPVFAKVVSIDPDNLQARELLAVCRIYAKDLKPAIRDLEALRAANPSDENVLFLLGFAYLREHEAEKARAIFQVMFESMGPARAQFLAGKANYEAAMFPDAEASFREVLRLDPRFPGVHGELGKVYMSLRRNDDAMRELRLELAADPGNADANFYLGALLVQQGSFEEAIPYLHQAIKAKPDAWAPYFNLGKALFRMGKPAEAVAPLQRAVALNPSDEVSAYHQLGQALRASGHDAEARSAFQKAEQLRAAALEATKVDTSAAGAR